MLSSFITDKVNKTQTKVMTEEIPCTSLHCCPSHSQTLYVLSRPSRTFLTPDSSTLECSAIPDSKKLTRLSKQKPGYLPRKHRNFPILLADEGHDQALCWAIRLKYCFISHNWYFHNHFKDLRYFTRNYATYALPVYVTYQKAKQDTLLV